MKTEKLPRAKLNAKTLFAGRTISTNPSPWEGGPLQAGFDKALDSRRLKAAADEVALMELINKSPGYTVGWYATRIDRPKHWVRRILYCYRDDGIVRSSEDFPFIWYLNSVEDEA